MRISPETYARKVAQDFTVPIDLKKVATCNDIMLVDGANLSQHNFCGFAANDESIRAIAFNSKLPAKKQRFVIAHEIGHMLLHSSSFLMHIDEDPYFLVPQAYDNNARANKDNEATRFAIELLVPDNHFMRDLIDCIRQSKRRTFVRDMAKKYDVEEWVIIAKLYKKFF